MTNLECPHVQTDRWAAIFVAILVIDHGKISIVDHGEEFDNSNPYMKFGNLGNK